VYKIAGFIRDLLYEAVYLSRKLSFRGLPSSMVQDFNFRLHRRYYPIYI